MNRRTDIHHLHPMSSFSVLHTDECVRWIHGVKLPTDRIFWKSNKQHDNITCLLIIQLTSTTDYNFENAPPLQLEKALAVTTGAFLGFRRFSHCRLEYHEYYGTNVYKKSTHKFRTT